MSRCSAIKVLNHAMSGPEGADNCQKFVDILGLRSIFPLFMKTPKTSKKTGPNRQEMEGGGWHQANVGFLVFKESKVKARIVIEYDMASRRHNVKAKGI